MGEMLIGEVLLKVGDNITTDHIMPAGAKVLPLRSNIPKIAEYVYYQVDPEFAKRAKQRSGGFIVGGDNYGQGSSREHAALAPMFLGIKLVVTKSFARIHLANLINFGILPATFINAPDYDDLKQGNQLEIQNVKEQVRTGDILEAENKSNGHKYSLRINLTSRQREIIIAGGLLNYTRAGGK